jgi:hypothetical protein
MKLKILTSVLLSAGIVLGSTNGAVATSTSVTNSEFTAVITKNIEERFNALKDFIKSIGYSKAIAELNNLGGASAVQDDDAIAIQGIIAQGSDRGGPLVCVEEGKEVVVSASTPKDIGTNVEMSSPAKEIVEALKKLPDGSPEKVTLSVNGVTYEAWGRKALDETMEKTSKNDMKGKTKYMCYIARSAS